MSQRKIVLEDGQEFYGEGFGASGDAVCEIVFDTSMVGYQGVLTDPAYAEKMVLMTYPLIGSYGINEEDNLSKAPFACGLIVREYKDSPSNFRYTKTLAEVMEEYGVPGISGVDTRAITRTLRAGMVKKAMITNTETTVEEALAAMKAWHAPKDILAQVSCKKRWYSRTQNPKYNVVAVDCGIAISAVRELNRLGCNVTIVPYNTSAADIAALAPQGVFYAGGPGSCTELSLAAPVASARELLGTVPMYGVGTGLMVMGIAAGAAPFRMKTGHFGAGQMVKDLRAGKVIPTTQTHNWALRPETLAGTGLVVTHLNLMDGSIEGVTSAQYPAFATEFYPAKGAGNEKGDELYQQFLRIMKEGGGEHA